MIELEGFVVERGGRRICEVAEWSCVAGERCAVVGANGSGKTTLLRALAGLGHDWQGTCRVAAPPRERVYVHQSPYLFSGTVQANIEYGLKARGVAVLQRRSQASRWAEVFDVASLLRQHVDTLSGGECRRVALARAFAVGVELLLLDEPLADLDDRGVALLGRAMGEASDSTILMSSPMAILEPLLPVRTLELTAS